MCGLAGFLDSSHGLDEGALIATARRMADRLRHRGPDDRGEWADRASGVALGFRRLAIVDLSPEGRQPMHSPGRRYVLAFNGEIYNHRDLRRELSREPGGALFRGRGDTEVMLAAIERWGLVEATRRFEGMFAFALWDRRERRLHLGRDRIGEKPLYYGWSRGSFLFGSEPKALEAHPDFRGEIRRDVLLTYLRRSCIPAPASIYRGVFKLPPATLLTIDGRATGTLPEPIPYWSPLEVAEAGTAHPFAGDDREAVDELDRLLRRAVSRQMAADVPLGAFLSGGIDSSAVVSMMQAEGDRPARTFTIGFREAGYDEAEDAGRVARHLGTDHTELYVTPAEAMSVIPTLPSLYDEPFADSSQIPTLLVAGLARRHVTVALSGDGGDELFGGYTRYCRPNARWYGLGGIPRSLRRSAAGVLTGLSPGSWDRALGPLRHALPRRLGGYASGERLHKLAELIDRAEDPEAVYQCLSSKWSRSSDVVLGVRLPRRPPEGLRGRPGLGGLAHRLMYMDLIAYLPDDILVKVDRASMGVGLEARAPFLDPRVVEFAWSLPLSMKIRGGRGKWALREVLGRYVPSALFERPKRGFCVPIGAWLRGPLRGWAEGLLGEDRLRREGFFDPAPIRRKWAEHASGAADWQHHLWDVLMFQAWLEARG